jgi:hypothetical protein
VRLIRPTMAALSAALVLAVLPSTAVAATDSHPVSDPPGAPQGAGLEPAAETVPLTPAPSLLVGETPTAEEALAAVVAAFRPVGDVPSRRGAARRTSVGGDLTMAMALLARQIDDLSVADRRLAERYLARPTDGTGDPDDFGYAPGAVERSHCGPGLCVTWVSSTRDAPPPADLDDDGVPDQVEVTRQVMESVWDRVVTRGGYKSPLRDRGAAHGEGPNSTFDVYLVDLGDVYYGYCATDPRAAQPGQAYCVLDDDYATSQFPRHTPTENLQVTAAHEFFHAVQFAYDVHEDWWFLEGTAAWIEDELYDGVDDNLQYLDQSQLRRPDVPLDFVGGSWLPYGSWIFWRFLGERFPEESGTGLPTIMRRTWQEADASDGTYSLKALEAVLDNRGTSFAQTYAEFVEANRHPGNKGHTHYEEGSSYRASPLLRTFRLTRRKPALGWRSVVLRQLTSRTVAFRPGEELLDKRWRIRVKVDAPPRQRGSFAQLTSYLRDGSIDTRVVRLDADGVGKRTASFSAPDVVRVELSLVNASTRYQCNKGTTASCSGLSRDSGRTTAFRAMLHR